MRRRRCPLLAAVLFLFLLPLFHRHHAASGTDTDTVTLAAPLMGNRTLVSAGSAKYVLGFFAPDPESGRAYLGIWFNGIPARTVVWVANRESPVLGGVGAAALRVLANGSLAIVVVNETDTANYDQQPVVWATPPPATASGSNATAQLLDNGNLVLRVPGAGVVWQSFDHPTDTLLPGMKLGIDFRTGLDRRMVSWRAAGDPSPGEYSFRLDPRGSPELFLYRGSARVYGSGPWNGYQFTGVPNLKSNSLLTFRFVSAADEAYYSYGVVDSAAVLTRFVLDSSGQIQRLMWIDMTRSWSLFWSYPLDECDGYRACGPYGVCSVERSPICGCAPGFDPRFPKEWALRDGSGGCRRRTDLACAGDGFAALTNMKLPESANATVDMSLTLDQCREACLRNCACRAYAGANVSAQGATGCFLWTGDLLDMRQFGKGGQNLFVRLAASDLPLSSSSPADTDGRTKRLVEIIVPSVAAPALLLLAGLCICAVRTRRRRTKEKEAIPLALLRDAQRQSAPFGRRNQIAASTDAQDESLHDGQQGGSQDCDLPSFDVETIQAATGNFSAHSKIGQGGFGPVYMGKLDSGQDIAVKRLSRRSTQGLREFKNEVKLIAKLQHRNLVRLLGCCIDGSERMLVYEYMHNRSLNTFLFRLGFRPLSALQAWRLWKDGESLEFMDQSIADTSNAAEVLKCIQIGLLCVQEQPKRRPTMSAVTTMLTCENPTLPEPCEPAFSTGRNHDDDDEDPEAKACRSNSASSWTCTVVEGR
ncbi:G-type lectin S-receptor-like serine/threonine-protein kinase B120 [Zea mays]|uniref:Receptor-like serine/threonine-protein kinase n=1 Tax=Zea mays TaxID=4577 RepID=A0A1D6KQI4_MAIZE|nr:G-type lectin S-receptor-like serine/threonine-protein kinase B120 [Zea mays]